MKILDRQGRSGSRYTVIKRRLNLALLFMLIGLGAAPLCGAAPGAVSGVVRDSSGIPQIGAVVQLLRPDLSVIASAYTNSKGAFSFTGVAPGRYAVKAMGTSFLPSLRENVRLRTTAIVNVTLNTLYEAMQWLPAERRGPETQEDDWRWTLRSAANRPLLRWLEDGPLVVVSDGPRSAPKLKARLVAMGRQGTFGENGERIDFELEDTPSDSRELLASVDFEPGTDGNLESMLGFRQELGYVGAVQSLAAISFHPEIQGETGAGLQEVALRNWETMNLGDSMEAEAGAEQVMARFGSGSPNVALASLPFVSVGWKDGAQTIRYRMATGVPDAAAHSQAEAAAWLPRVSSRNGALVIERGTHQEIGWEHNSEAAEYSLLVYADQFKNSMMQASARWSGEAAAYGANALYDPASRIVRAAGAGYSSTGLVASMEHRLPAGNSIRISYATGDALVLTHLQGAVSLDQIVKAARPRRAEMYSISLSGTLEGTGTRWRASYRWQPEDTATRIAAYAANSAEPYLNVHLRQPMRRLRDGNKRLDAMLDVRNALGEGTPKFVLTDGSLLVFAQDQRSVSAGVAFTF